MKAKGNKMKKFIKICTCGIAAAMILSGCSNQTGTGNQTDSTEQTDSTGQTADATPSQTGATRETIDVAEDNHTLSAAADQVELGDYIGLTIPANTITVADEEVEQQITNILSQNPIEEEVMDRPAAEGDTVNIDYVGKKDGVAFAGGSGQGYDLTLGAGQFIPGFEEGLIGVEAGEERDLNLTFPEDYQTADLAGAEVVFTVKVNSIKSIKEAELTDDFVKEYAESAQNVAEYRVEVQNSIQNILMQEVAWVLALNNGQFEITDATLEETKAEAKEYLDQQYMMYYGMTTDQLVSQGQIDEAQFDEGMNQQAIGMIKSRLMVEAIAAEENFKVTDEDIENLADEFEVYADAQDMLEKVGEDTVNEYILQDKVIEFIVENAVVE